MTSPSKHAVMRSESQTSRTRRRSVADRQAPGGPPPPKPLGASSSSSSSSFHHSHRSQQSHHSQLSQMSQKSYQSQTSYESSAASYESSSRAFRPPITYDIAPPTDSSGNPLNESKALVMPDSFDDITTLGDGGTTVGQNTLTRATLTPHETRTSAVSTGSEYPHMTSTALRPDQNASLVSSLGTGQGGAAQNAPIPKTSTTTPPPAPYTLNIMVRQFTKYAERKLSECVNRYPLEEDINVAEILSEGVDPAFDRTIVSLGHIAKTSRRMVIDAAMHWRRGKSELRDATLQRLEKDAEEFNRSRTRDRTRDRTRSPSDLSSRRSSRSASQTPTDTASEFSSTTLMERVANSRKQYIQAERQLNISTYILLRVMLEVVRQGSWASAWDTEFESIMYNYLLHLSPVLLNQSLVHSANWVICAQLVGEMSAKSFDSVTRRFVLDLEKIPPPGCPPDEEASYCMLVQSMSYLSFTNESVEKFDREVDFLFYVARFFSQCTNDTISLVYCEVVSHILLNMAGSLSAEVNFPAWTEVVDIIYKKSREIAAAERSDRFWCSATTLEVAVLCVSPKPQFVARWKGVAEALIRRLKPRQSLLEKSVSLICVARLLWAYLFHYNDTLNAKTNNMKWLASLLFQNGAHKHHWLTCDKELVLCTAQILRAMAYSQLNFTLEKVLLPLFKSGFNGVSLDGLSYERAQLCVRAYGAILSDCKHAERPPFPTDEVVEEAENPLVFSNDTDSLEVFAPTSSNLAVHREISTLIQHLLFLLDDDIGCKFLDEAPTNPAYTELSTKSSRIPSLQSRISSSLFKTVDKTEPKQDLFAQTIAFVSWCAEVGNAAVYRRTIELLVKNLIDEDEDVSKYSLDALQLLIVRKNPNVVTSTFTTVAFYLDEKAASYVSHEYLSSDKYIQLLTAYVKVIQTWIFSLYKTGEEEEADTKSSLYDVNKGFATQKVRERVKLDPMQINNMVTMVDQIEGNGLFFFFNHDCRVRFWGTEILRSVMDFDGILKDMTDEGDSGTNFPHHERSQSKFVDETGTRVVQYLINKDLLELIVPKRRLLSEAERKRVARISKNRQLALMGVAQSQHGVDAALWFKVFEDVLEGLVEEYPMQIAIVRTLSCIRLVQLYDAVVAVSNGRGVGDSSSLIWDYMLYLKVACCSLTSTADQRVHIPAQSLSGSSGSGHSRKKSQPLFTVQHQKITSAKAIFRITVPLLTTANTKLKDALVEGLSCLNVNIFHSFMESVDSALNGTGTTLDAPPLHRKPSLAITSSAMMTLHSRSMSYSPKMASAAAAGNKRTGPASTQLTTEICCILNKVIAKFTRHNRQFLDEWILSKLQSLLLDVQTKLLLPSNQTNYTYQRLRKYFCGLLESLHKELRKRGQVEQWLPFSFRRQAFEFMLQWCGYGRDKPLFEQRYSSMGASAAGDVALRASLEMQKLQLQFAAISCMTSLCESPTVVGGESFDFAALLDWTDQLVRTKNEGMIGMAKKAVLNLLTVNESPREVFDMVVSRCYQSEELMAHYFLVLNEAFVKGIQLDYRAYRPLALALFASGSDSYAVRAAAASLVEFTENSFYGSKGCLKYVDSICSHSRIIYKKALFKLSQYFAKNYPGERFMMISELTMLFHMVGPGPRRDIISVLLPWVQHAELNLEDASDPAVRECSLMVLYNFVMITLKFSHRIQNEVETLWYTLGSGLGGASASQIFRFVTDNCLVLKNMAFFEASRQIIVSLAPIQSFGIVQTLLESLVPKAMVPSEPAQSELIIRLVDSSENDSIDSQSQSAVNLPGRPPPSRALSGSPATPRSSTFGRSQYGGHHSRQESAASRQRSHSRQVSHVSQLSHSSVAPSRPLSHSHTVVASDFPYMADLISELQSASETASLPALSRGELHLVFLVDCILSPKEPPVDASVDAAVKSHLPLLVHFSFFLLDHQLEVVRNQARALLLHLVNQYGDQTKAADIISMLRAPDYAKQIWQYADLVDAKTAGSIPDSMDTLVRGVMAVFEDTVPNFQQDWSRVAIEWATSCKVMHIASRSFQVFRCLISFLDQGMLRSMLSCLSNTIADDSPGIQSFALQILMTLNAITAELRSELLIDFPQLFWSSVASLTTIHEREFIEILSSLSKFISKIDLDSADTVECLKSTFPTNWETVFEGLQQLVMTGLRSSTAYKPSLDLLCRLDLLNDSQIIGVGKERVLMAVLANLPRFLLAHTQQRFPDELVKSANVIAALAEKNGLPGLQRVVTSLVYKRFRNKDDFMSQIVNEIRRAFFPQYAKQTLVFLLGLLYNRMSWVKTETMAVLKYVFRAVDLTAPEFANTGADLVAPLLRLLNTKHADQALQVLDEATSIPASPFDKHYLMMSASDKSMRKEYERMETLFGIPDDTGWSVPMPGVSRARTRNNLHAVYSTCDDPSNEAAGPVVAAINTQTTSAAVQTAAVQTPLDVTSPLDAVVSGDMISLSSLDRSLNGPSYVLNNSISPEVQRQYNPLTNPLSGQLVDVPETFTGRIETLGDLTSFFGPSELEKEKELFGKSFERNYNNSINRLYSHGAESSASNSFGHSLTSSLFGHVRAVGNPFAASSYAHKFDGSAETRALRASGAVKLDENDAGASIVPPARPLDNRTALGGKRRTVQPVLGQKEEQDGLFGLELLGRGHKKPGVLNSSSNGTTGNNNVSNDTANGNSLSLAIGPLGSSKGLRTPRMPRSPYKRERFRLGTKQRTADRSSS